MLGGLALCAWGLGTTALVRPSEAVEAVLVLLSLAAWFVGALAMVGFVRWYFAEEKQRMQEYARRDSTREKP